MARRIHLRPDLSADELERRYRAAKVPHERMWWQLLWLLAQGQLAKDIAESTRYSRYWIGHIAKRYNAEGPKACTIGSSSIRIARRPSIGAATGVEATPTCAGRLTAFLESASHAYSKAATSALRASWNAPVRGCGVLGLSTAPLLFGRVTTQRLARLL